MANIAHEEILKICKSKNDLYRFLYFECDYYLPEPKYTSLSFYNDVWGEKKKVCYIFLIVLYYFLTYFLIFYLKIMV